MFIQTRLSTPKRFNKFGRQTRTFITKKRKNVQSSLGQTDYSQYFLAVFLLRIVRNKFNKDSTPCTSLFPAVLNKLVTSHIS